MALSLFREWLLSFSQFTIFSKLKAPADDKPNDIRNKIETTVEKKENACHQRPTPPPHTHTQTRGPKSRHSVAELIVEL